MSDVRWPFIESLAPLLSCQSAPPRQRHCDHFGAPTPVPDLAVDSADSGPRHYQLLDLRELSLVAGSASVTMSTFTPVGALWNRQQLFTKTPDDVITIRTRPSEPATTLLTEQQRNEKPQEVRYA